MKRAWKKSWWCANVFGAGVVVIALSVASCGGSTASNPKTEEAAKPAEPEVPPDIQQVADSALGSETDVLAFGDLTRTGKQQVLAINRLKKALKGAVPGILLTRAVVVENDGGNWKQVFLCDEHLKNTNGFLEGTPLAGVNGWRLQYEQHEDTGLVMYFTPLEKPAGGYVQMIGVRWNPKVKRYQSLDRTYQQFQGETPALETPEMNLRRK
ncbi:MAG: hypothetical protein WBC04_09965 [Candidatus Acidiferrales bacterium]